MRDPDFRSSVKVEGIPYGVRAHKYKFEEKEDAYIGDAERWRVGNEQEIESGAPCWRTPPYILAGSAARSCRLRSVVGMRSLCAVRSP